MRVPPAAFVREPAWLATNSDFHLSATKAFPARGSQPRGADLRSHPRCRTARRLHRESAIFCTLTVHAGVSTRCGTDRRQRRTIGSPARETSAGSKVAKVIRLSKAAPASHQGSTAANCSGPQRIVPAGSKTPRQHVLCGV